VTLKPIGAVGFLRFDYLLAVVMAAEVSVLIAAAAAAAALAGLAEGEVRSVRKWGFEVSRVVDAHFLAYWTVVELETQVYCSLAVKVEVCWKIARLQKRTLLGSEDHPLQIRSYYLEDGTC
jgi:hypothetical protein